MYSEMFIGFTGRPLYCTTTNYNITIVDAYSIDCGPHRIMYYHRLLLVVTAGAFAAAAVMAADITCSNTDLETSCRVKFPDRLVVDNDNVYVGLENKLVRFGLQLELQATVDRPASNDTVDACKRFKQPDCGNYILTMLITNLTDKDISANADLLPLVNKTVLFICSTFGFSPQCQLCDAKNISHCVNTSAARKLGYSPYDRRLNNVYTLTKDRVFYTGSAFDDKNALRAVAKFPNPFNGTKFSLYTFPSQTWRWLFNPIFISIYEVDQYIYFFWREEAFEADRRVYTRVGRVCKSDNGLGSNSSNPSVFSTFVKARMTCSVPSDSNNRYPFQYNELQATHLLDSGGSPVLYAVFSTPSNGPASSAICTYTFGSEENSLNTVFNGDYLFGDSGSEDWTTVNNPAPFDCPGEGPNQRSTQDAERYLLMEEAVQQSTLVYNETGAYITALLVDTIQWDGQTLEVFYIGLSNGVVKQVVPNVSEVKLYTVETGQAINKLVLHEYNGRKYCYITSDDNIAVVQLGHCDYYQTCSQCSSDIYCRWTEDSCTSNITLTANSCPTAIPTTTTNSVEVTTVYRTSTQTVTIETCSTPAPIPGIVNSAASTGSEEKTCNNLPVVIGTAFGGIIFGFIIGAVVFVTVYLIKRPRATPNKVAEKQQSVESKGCDYDDDAFGPPSTNQPGNYYYSHSSQTNGRIGNGHLTTSSRARTESTKRLMSISSDISPDSPSPPNTLRMPKHDE